MPKITGSRTAERRPTLVGKLGRGRVCALHKASIELPSDMLGVVYVSLDDAGGWRLLLAKELRTAEFDIDLNNAM